MSFDSVNNMRYMFWKKKLIYMKDEKSQSTAKAVKKFNIVSFLFISGIIIAIIIALLLSYINKNFDDIGGM